MEGRTIKVDYLSRVEGEGSLFLKVRNDAVEEARLEIFEPPRFFEALLRGRDFREAPDITSRICGICPVAYLMSASHAMEAIAGVKVGGPLRELRRLLYCGEWIESHALHVFMLHLPDFLGFPDAVRMSADHPILVRDALRLKKLGNRIMAALGGREIHPINVKVGGFYKAPTPRELESLRPELEWASGFCRESLAFLSTLPFPPFDQEYEFVALRHPDEYPLNEGSLVSNRGMNVPVSEYESVLEETHVPWSTALVTHVVGRGAAHMGPLARYSLNFDRLFPNVQDLARQSGLGRTCQNPFKSILVRMVEVYYAVEEARRILGSYAQPATSAVEVAPRAGRGHGATEAPRGICYQRYDIDEGGLITACKIVAPTSVNQSTIALDLHRFAGERLDLDDAALSAACEQAIRNYDPCISCSCHFLKLKVDRA